MNLTDELICQMIEEITGEEGILPETELLESGLLDSFGVVTLLAELEDRYNCVLYPTRLPRDVFSTPAHIAQVARETQGIR